MYNAARCSLGNEQITPRPNRTARGALREPGNQQAGCGRGWRRASGQRPAPKKQKPSDEERLRVLRMLEEGKITPEQASELLVALEGR